MLTTIITSSWVVKSIVAKKFIFRRTVLDTPLLVYLLTLLLSTLFSIDPRTSIFGYYGRFNGGLISQFCYCILYWAFVSNINKDQVLKAIKYLLASVAIVSILGIFEHFKVFATCAPIIYSNISSPENNQVFEKFLQLNSYEKFNFLFQKNCWVQDVQSRVFSTVGQPNWLAAVIVALIPFAWISYLNQSKVSKKIFLIALSSLYLTTLIFTKSRSGLLALSIESLIFWSFALWRDKFKHVKEFTVLTLISLGLVFTFTFRFESKSEPTNNNTNTTLESGGTESGTIRKYVWLGALEVFRHYPILGTGPETFAFSFPMYKPAGHNLTSEWDFIYNKAHNEFLNYLANTGLLGFLSYMSLIIYTIAVFLKSKRYEYLAGYIGILITNFFGFSVVPVSLLFFLFPALAIVTNLNEKDNNQNRKVTIDQKFVILFVFIINLFLLNTIYKYWKSDVYYNVSKTIKDNEKAKSEIEKALQVSPNEPIYISQKSFLTNDINLSLKALDLAPYNQNIIRVLVNNLVKSSDENSENLLLAENVLLSSIESSPNDPRLYYQLGILQLKINKNNEAIQSLEKAVDLKPNYKEVRFALGITFQALEEKEKAKEELEYILKNIDPNDELTKKYLNELSQPQK